jgi:hypothetical protein
VQAARTAITVALLLPLSERRNSTVALLRHIPVLVLVQSVAVALPVRMGQAVQAHRIAEQPEVQAVPVMLVLAALGALLGAVMAALALNSRLQQAARLDRAAVVVVDLAAGPVPVAVFMDLAAPADQMAVLARSDAKE